MNYLKLSTMEYPRHEVDVAPGDEADYVEVEQTTPPAYNRTTQYLTQTAPVQSNGAWESVWVVNDMTPEQIALYEAMNPKPRRRNSPPLTNSGSTPNVIE